MTPVVMMSAAKISWLCKLNWL